MHEGTNTVCQKHQRGSGGGVNNSTVVNTGAAGLSRAGILPMKQMCLLTHHHCMSIVPLRHTCFIGRIPALLRPVFTTVPQCLQGQPGILPHDLLRCKPAQYTLQSNTKQYAICSPEHKKPRNGVHPTGTPLRSMPVSAALNGEHVDLTTSQLKHGCWGLSCCL